MNELDRSAGNLPPRQHLRNSADQRALYERFGAMAYGVILQIVPQTHLAQKALLEVFTSSQLPSFSNTSTNPAIAIIRLARAKALELKAKSRDREAVFIEPISPAGGYSPESIFDLMFRQGYSFEAIAEQVGISKPEQLKAIRDFIQLFRRS